MVPQAALLANCANFRIHPLCDFSLSFRVRLHVGTIISCLPACPRSVLAAGVERPDTAITNVYARAGFLLETVELLIRALTSLLGLKYRIVLAGTATRRPFLGFRPVRGPRCRVWK